MNFVNLHRHDEYSMRDAIGTCEQYAKLLKSRDEKYMSVTNHGSVGGWIKQRNVCEKNGLKAIYGMEAYHDDYRGDDPEEKKKHRSANHLILIAKNYEGYSNIIRIHNDAQLNGFYYTPRVNDEALRKWGKGIISSSACYAGEIPRLLTAGETEKAKERYQFYKSCFDSFYIEIQLIEMKEQVELNRKLIAFAKEVGAPLVATQDSHYLYAENTTTHKIMMCIRQKRTVEETEKTDDDTWTFSVENLYCRSYEQVKDLYYNGFLADGVQITFKDDVFTEEVFNEACANTVKIAEEVEDIKVDTSIKLPKICDDSEKEFKRLVMEGFHALSLDKKPNADVYLARIKHEIDVITLAGWSDYFLIVKMIVDEARRLKGDWGVAKGRGCFRNFCPVIKADNVQVPICDIKVGDYVYSHDGTVNRVYDTLVYDIDEEIVSIDFCCWAGEIECTKDHKIMIYRDSLQVWEHAGNLKAGDVVCSVFDKDRKELNKGRTVANVKFSHYNGKVYDLSVENTHTFNISGAVVSNSAGGSLASYVLGIVGLDPIEYDLDFARFLDFSRTETTVCTFEIGGVNEKDQI